MLQSFKHLLINESILWNPDNQNVGRIIQVGSTKPDLHSLALQIYYMCMQNNNRIHSVWIPREENTLAAHYSRSNDTDDFGIDSKTFYFIQRKLGICTIDRFADDKNTKLWKAINTHRTDVTENPQIDDIIWKYSFFICICQLRFANWINIHN